MTDDVTDTPDVDDVAELVALNVRNAMAIQFVGRIAAYDRDTFSASVRRVVRGRRWDPIERLLASYLPETVHNVRVAQHYTDAGGLILPYQPGDYVWCEVADRSHAEWFARGGDDVEPRDLRRFDAADVVVTGPIRPRNDAPDSNATHATDPVLNGDPVHLGDANPATEQWVALSNKVDDFIFMLDTAFKAGWVVLPGDGGAALKAAYAAATLALYPLTGGTPTSTAASKVKAT